MSIDDREYAKDKVTVMGSRRSAPNRAKRILGLGAVFHPQARPAIKVGAAPAEPVAASEKMPFGGAFSGRGDSFALLCALGRV